uniref:Uncharacterized protein n=1 Tax=Gopherus agassizii TaxID=38772 RepID=A0A452IXJ9_9SAUR
MLYRHHTPEPLTNPPASASQVAGITGAHHLTQPTALIIIMIPLLSPQWRRITFITYSSCAVQLGI